MLLLLIAYSVLWSQSDAPFPVEGRLKFVDPPAEAVAPEAAVVRFHPLAGGPDVSARPDRDGKFVIANFPPGRYSLVFPIPGRIESFTFHDRELAPEGFELRPEAGGALSLVVSLKTGGLSVTVQNFPESELDVVALLVPAEPRLTMRESCVKNDVTESKTEFHAVPAGRYRLLVFDGEFESAVAKFAPRSPEFLKNQETMVDVPGDGTADVLVTYVNGETVRNAIARFAPSN